MKSTIYLPKKLEIGFRKRADTYTGKLAYVVCYDLKGKMRKEASWNGWRDKNIPSEKYDNEPTSGFVLNKKVGGYKSDWNMRQSYIRVYDPRGFEFEITPENLLFILENANSIKGKGLEGEFVYGWSGKDLVLIPTEAPDYKELTEYNSLLNSTVNMQGKDLVIGATYGSRKNESLVYMGRFDRYELKRDYRGYEPDETINKGKYYYFFNLSCSGRYMSFETYKSIGKTIIKTISEECTSRYAELFSKLEKQVYYSPYDPTKDEYIRYTWDKVKSLAVREDSKEREYFTEVRLFAKIDGTYEKVLLGYTYNKLNEYISTVRRASYNRYNTYKMETLIMEGNPKEIFDSVEFYHKKEYLENGNLYQEIGI